LGTFLAIALVARLEGEMSVTALVVDDSPAARQMISYHLRAVGCEVIGEAENADRALKLFREHKPDIVTLDLVMPAIFNLDSLGLLRSMKVERPQVATIVVSWIPFNKIRSDFVEQGAVAYLVKPVTKLSFEPVRTRLLQIFPEPASIHERTER
jgi:YesN/AraC family two-component response regulator